MLKNYFTIALNNLLKNKLYSAINIAGLAIGLAACIIIGLYVRDQSSYDKPWKDSDRIYRVNYSVQNPGRELLKWSTAPCTDHACTGRIFLRIKSSKAHGNSRDRGSSIREPHKFREQVVFVDPSFIEMFQVQGPGGESGKYTHGQEQHCN